MHAGWLDHFLTAYEGHYRPASVEACLVRALHRDRASAVSTSKRWIFWSLHQRGIAYGVPVGLPGFRAGDGAPDPTRTFGAFLTTWCDLALEVEAIVRGQARTRKLREWLLCCLAALVEEVALAGQLHSACQSEAATPRKLLKQAQKEIEESLDERRYVVGNPLLGLPLRNGLVYSDARLVGRIALKIAHDGAVDPQAFSRLLDFAHGERTVLVAALCALVARDAKLPEQALRIAKSQLENVGLPHDDVVRLQETLDHPPTTAELVARVERRHGTGYLLGQLWLASLVDGQITPAERAFVEEVAAGLGVPPARLKRVQGRVEQFYVEHKALFDLFTAEQYYGAVEEGAYDRITRLVLGNMEALVTEIRQTVELSGLLTKAAAGQTLSDAERAKVREQLLDVVRAVPSLAIFALPGGALLLPILLKVLPFDLRPTAFREVGKKK